MTTSNAFSGYTADDILGMPADEPERLFTGAAGTARAEFRRLAALWHPDRNHDRRASQVFQHIETLYRLAETRLASGCWLTGDMLRLHARDGRVIEVRYRKHRHFELGDMYISPTVVAYVLPAENADLYANAQRMIGSLHFANPGMHETISPALPSIAGAFELQHGVLMIIHKSPQQILLRDVLGHLGGKIEARHTAWIVSALLNLACYLEYAGITHNAISPDTCFISPGEHSVALLGGWWYACACGEKLRAAPERSMRVAPPDILNSKRADPRLDLELIRSTARELLGDEAGTSLPHRNAVPRALADWLRIASSGSALQDYEYWQKRVLPESFGPRRFVRLDVSVDDIYQ